MGGLVFKGSSPIKKEDIKPTLSRFIQELSRVFPEAKEHFKSFEIVGSAGNKDVSGDIDLALDEKAFKNLEDWDIEESKVQELVAVFKKRARTASDAMLVKRAIITLLAKKLNEDSLNIEADDKGSGNGTLFCQFPQFDSNKNELDKRVQIDINIGNPDWLKFAYHSGPSDDPLVKGLHRTQLMLCLFVEKGFVFSHNYGVKDRETNKIVASTPEKAIDLLNDLYGFDVTENILSDYHKLQKFLQKNLDENELHNIWNRYLKILDSTRCDIPSDMQNYWLDNQDELGLTGKFLPSSSKLYAFRSDF